MGSKSPPCTITSWAANPARCTCTSAGTASRASLPRRCEKPWARARLRSAPDQPGPSPRQRQPRRRAPLRQARNLSLPPRRAPIRRSAWTRSPLTVAIDQALGRKGKVNGGVYAVSIPRAETPRDHGMEVPEAMGSAIAVNFQPTGGGKAAITGDFVLTADEVNPVLKALRQNGIEITALHNHMLDDEPRLFFMHFWANDDAQNTFGPTMTPRNSRR